MNDPDARVAPGAVRFYRVAKFVSYSQSEVKGFLHNATKSRHLGACSPVGLNHQPAPRVFVDDKSKTMLYVCKLLGVKLHGDVNHNSPSFD